MYLKTLGLLLHEVPDFISWDRYFYNFVILLSLFAQFVTFLIKH